MPPIPAAQTAAFGVSLSSANDPLQTLFPVRRNGRYFFGAFSLNTFLEVRLLFRQIGSSVCLLTALMTLASCQSMADADRAFHQDADLARLEHLEYWTGLVEEYENVTGEYPFASSLPAKDSIGLVRIATADQSQFFTPGSDKYLRDLDNNAKSRFQEHSMADFVAELESGLGRTVEEKYDIQYVPSGSPIWYNYFVTEAGYLVWVTCITCDVTLISTLLYDGYTPTVNITSPGMKDSVSKALTRSEMLSHPIFLQWKSRPFVKEEFVRYRENLHRSDSKESR